ncbi:DNA methylase [Streptococcus pyogenes]|nr:DNA methylase [Streptococcus pyogenes]VGV48200.1 DNA methylase [Streptococcus pyogenes]VGV51928.1 DNA methylase [Streptococcus pyogenes]VHC00362.1 DNA methylase [Streptococcus pyogenes]
MQAFKINNRLEVLSLSLLIKNATKKGYLIADNGDGIDTAYPDSKIRRGRVQKSMSHTITTDDSKGVLENYRIRKLTPKECWRLMGCSDEDFGKAQAVNSNSQLYKQAGNAIVVDVLEAIFKQLFLTEVQNEY